MFICMFATVAYAGTSLKLSKTTASHGESIVVSGTHEADSYVTVKVVDEQNNIVFLDILKSDASGNFSVQLIVPSDTTSKTLTVIAGSGSDVATTTLQIVKPTPTPAPTPSPTPNKTPQPTVKPTRTPKPTQTPVHTTAPTTMPMPTATATASPAAQKTETPTSTPQSSAAPIETIKPSLIEENEEQGTITIEINTEELPEGTDMIVLPGGNTIDVTNTETILLEISVEYLNENGTLTIIPINEEGTPLGMYSIEVADDATIDAEKGWSQILSILLWILIAAAILAGAILLFILIKKKK